jgi:hypothetical protein
MISGDLLDGRFRLRDRLGVGGMSVVWRAHDEVLGRDVAVKVLSPHLARDAALLDRIRDEARAVARLRHPNIVDVYDFGEAPGPVPYVVMEVVEGRSLADLLTGGALPWRLAVLIGAQVAAALAAAHDRGVVHRDVKPGNVVVAGARVKLVDFGISAVSGDDDRTAGLLLGTPAYLAPERLERGAVRPATDVYALGLLLYRALAGGLPWRASTATQMLRAHRYQEPHPLPWIAGLPAEVADLCRQSLAKDPARRPTAAAAATVLAAAAGIDLAVLALPGVVEGEIPQPAPAATVRRTASRSGTTTRPLAVRPATLRRLAARSPRRVAVVTGTGALLVAGAFLATTLPGVLGGPRAQAQAGTPVTPSASAGAPTGPAAQPAPGPECAVGYVVTAAGGRFTTEVSIANTGAVPIPAAPLTFDLPGKQWLRSGDPGAWQQDGRTVTARLADLAPGGRHTATLRGTYQGVNAMPNRFQLDDTTCRVVLSVAAGTPTQAAPAPGGTVKTGAGKAEPVKAEPGKAAKPEKKGKEKPEPDEDEDEGDED